MKIFEASELIINPDGSVFHLHLHPQQLAGKIILVGDPGRVSSVSKHFEKIESKIESREFHSHTGFYDGKRITVVSTGIGCDNIDIVLNELDALANINFETRTQNKVLRSLEIVRIGTCGGLQENIPIGSYIASRKSIGFDGLLNFYAGRNDVCDLLLEEAFTRHLDWNPLLCAPYVVDSDPELFTRISGDDMIKGITISCNGFFGPQGRELRIPLADPAQNRKVESFEFEKMKVLNYEMESSALQGLSCLLGHKATTCCMVIANRHNKEAKADYKEDMNRLIQLVLDRI